MLSAMLEDFGGYRMMSYSDSRSRSEESVSPQFDKIKEVKSYREVNPPSLRLMTPMESRVPGRQGSHVANEWNPAEQS